MPNRIIRRAPPETTEQKVGKGIIECLKYVLKCMCCMLKVGVKQANDNLANGNANVAAGAIHDGLMVGEIIIDAGLNDLQGRLRNIPEDHPEIIRAFDRVEDTADKTLRIASIIANYIVHTLLHQSGNDHLKSVSDVIVEAIRSRIEAMSDHGIAWVEHMFVLINEQRIGEAVNELGVNLIIDSLRRHGDMLATELENTLHNTIQLSEDVIEVIRNDVLPSTPPSTPNSSPNHFFDIPAIAEPEDIEIMYITHNHSNEAETKHDSDVVEAKQETESPKDEQQESMFGGIVMQSIAFVEDVIEALVNQLAAEEESSPSNPVSRSLSLQVESPQAVLEASAADDEEEHKDNEEPKEIASPASPVRMALSGGLDLRLSIGTINSDMAVVNPVPSAISRTEQPIILVDAAVSTDTCLPY